MRRLDQLGPDLPAREQGAARRTSVGCSRWRSPSTTQPTPMPEAARAGAGRCSDGNPGSPLLLRFSWRTFVAKAGASMPCQRHTGSSEAMIRFMALNGRTFLLWPARSAPARRGSHGAASRRIAPRSDPFLFRPPGARSLEPARPSPRATSWMRSSRTWSRHGARRDVGLAAGCGGSDRAVSTSATSTSRSGRVSSSPAGFGELTAEDVSSRSSVADPRTNPCGDDWAGARPGRGQGPVFRHDRAEGAVRPAGWTTTWCAARARSSRRRRSRPRGRKFDRAACQHVGRPYSEWQPKQKMILARNPDFYGLAPDSRRCTSSRSRTRRPPRSRSRPGNSTTRISACPRTLT